MGMEVHPFDRLARAIDELAASATFDEEFFIQLGACNYSPQHARWERFLSFGDLCERIREASAVITHAGAGSTLTCIQQGKVPIMVPRRARDHEHVDDHQVSFTDKMCEIGYATAAREMSELPAAITAVQGRGPTVAAPARSSELTDWLEEFWAGLRPRGN